MIELYNKNYFSCAEVIMVLFYIGKIRILTKFLTETKILDLSFSFNFILTNFK